MVIGAALFVTAVAIVGIYVFVEMKRLRHKAFAIFLIMLILFAYISFALVFKERVIDWKSASGIIEAGRIYFSWLGSIFGNVKTITGHAIDMDWTGNATAG